MEVEKEVMGGSRGGGREVEGEERNERGKPTRKGVCTKGSPSHSSAPSPSPMSPSHPAARPIPLIVTFRSPPPVPHCPQLRSSSTERDIQERKNWNLSTSCKTGKRKTGLERLPPAASMTRNTGRMSCRIQDLRGGDQSAARKE
jgi:hypothetical protein